MIGLALIIAFAALIVAFVKRGRYFKQVVVVELLTVVAFVITVHASNSTDPQRPFSGIGPAIIGSAVIFVLAVVALSLSFVKKP